MQVSAVTAGYLSNSRAMLNNRCDNSAKNISQNVSNPQYAKLPYNYRYNSNVSFGEFFDPNRTVPHIDYEEYKAMSPATKQRYRKRYKAFSTDKMINKSNLVDQRYTYMPLQNEHVMDEFLSIGKYYSQYKDQPIICLGRSPKWFLNASLWMKDGIDNYTPVSFSKNWFKVNYRDGLIPVPANMPTEKEEAAYVKYLKRIKADPERIVENMRATGKRTIITDYIDTGKGVSSFLDLMSREAEKAGILEEFSKSIKIVGIGSTEYICDRMKRDVVETPEVLMPPKLVPYKKNVEQTFKDMDGFMFEQMLINQNVNECRSTYYPHEAWTVYKPDQFRTGLITDMKKVKSMLKQLKQSGERSMSSFDPAMYDYRNLLNFRILDALFTRNLLKIIHKSKL